MILKGYIEKGEKMIDAVVRVASLAGQNGFIGYAIHCSKCNEPFVDEDGWYSCYCTRKIYDNYKSTTPTKENE